VFDRDLGEAEIRRRLVAKNIRIVYQDSGGSLDDMFLSQFPFYRGVAKQYSSDMFKLVVDVDNEAMFFISHE
jgi:hypothetical protein